MPFWDDSILDESAGSIVKFEENPMDPATLKQIQEQTGIDFNPDNYVRVNYENLIGNGVNTNEVGRPWCPV